MWEVLMFNIERELTNEEIEGIRTKAKKVLDGPEAKAALQAYNIHTAGRNPESVLESIVKADRHNHDFQITDAWPLYVKLTLGTNGWQFGYGYVGSTE